MNFTLTDEQKKKFEDWQASKELAPATIGGAYTFCFNPTGIGTFVTVKCADGSELDLNDYESF